MLLGSVALTFSTCLSGGCSKIAASNQMVRIKESAVEIIQETVDNFDYTDYDLTFSEQESFSKQKLLSYAKENKLFADDVL